VRSLSLERVACVAVALWLAPIGCRPADVQRAAALSTDGASGAADGSASAALALASVGAAASGALEGGALEGGAPEGGALGTARPSRALPTAARLLAPFRDAKVHGFVALTSTDPALHDAPPRVVASLARGDTLDLARPVLVASFTKLWTAVAALRMVARGELSLDETVKDALPELASRPWATSTLRELLTHTSLVPELDEKGGYYRRPDVDFSAPVPVLAKYIPRDWTEKRGVYKYRNAELALVGAILAARSKTSAERVLAKEIFEPAGMTHAGLLVTTSTPPGLDLAPMGPIRPRNFFTAGAGYASASDLLAFFEALGGATLLSPASKALLFEGAKDRGHGALGCWAYPFATADGATTLLVERPGSFGNVRLFAAFFPEEQRAVVAWTGDGLEIARPLTGKGLGAALARAALE
jgi:D-alanyl-D-alanine carboxypeptidase